MTATNNKQFQQYLLAAGSVMLVAALGIAFISFIMAFLDYAFNMFFLANKTTGNYLTIVPRH